MVLTKADEQDFYYNKNAPRNKCKCSSCYASFENYDDGSDKRDELKRTEAEERDMLKRLKAKYESDKA
jgi:hypothetical protein